MTPTNRNQSANTFFGYPQLQWAEQHQATIRRIVAEERQAHDVQAARPSLLARAALLPATARDWAATIATSARRAKVAR